MGIAPQRFEELASFAHVVEHGGFTAAERATGVPKSRLSRHLAQLEASMGVRLIQRSTRRFAVTDIGRQVLTHARAMLQEAEAAHTLTEEHSGAPRGIVRLACPPALLGAAVAPLLVAFLNAWPQVQLRVQASNRNIDVWNDGVDLALRVRTAGAELPLEEIMRPLALSPHLLVAAPRLLATVSPHVTPGDLARLPTLGLGNSPEEQRWVLLGPAGARAEHPHTPRLIADDTTMLLDAALAGVGCAVLPRMLAHDALASGTLQEVLPGWAPPPGMVQAVYASREGMRPAVRKLIDSLAEGFKSLIAHGRCVEAPQ